MSRRTVTKYKEEFKRSSANLAVNAEQSIKLTAKELGVHPTTLHGWVRKYGSNKQNQDEQVGMTAGAMDELKALKKENTRLLQEIY